MGLWIPTAMECSYVRATQNGDLLGTHRGHNKLFPVVCGIPPGGPFIQRQSKKRTSSQCRVAGLGGVHPDGLVKFASSARGPHDSSWPEELVTSIQEAKYQEGAK